MTDSYLAEFFRRALDTLETAAKAATVDQAGGETWNVESDEDGDGWFRRASVFTEAGDTVADMIDPDGKEPTAQHIAIHDPRAVLARVTAERAILIEHRPELFQVTPDGGEVNLDPPWSCSRCWDPDKDEIENWPCSTLRLLAYGHRFDADGYDPAWAPEGVDD